MILDSSLRSATFRMTECQHYLVNAGRSQDGSPSALKSLSCTFCRPSGTHPISWLPSRLQIRQVGQAGKLGGNYARQLIPAEPQRRQVGQTAQFCGNCARQLIEGEIQVL